MLPSIPVSALQFRVGYRAYHREPLPRHHGVTRYARLGSVKRLLCDDQARRAYTEPVHGDIIEDDCRHWDDLSLCRPEPVLIEHPADVPWAVISFAGSQNISVEEAARRLQLKDRRLWEQDRNGWLAAHGLAVAA